LELSRSGHHADCKELSLRFTPEPDDRHEAAAAIEAHLNGTKPLNIDMQELNAVLLDGGETNLSAALPC